MTGTKVQPKGIFNYNGEAQTRFNKVVKQYDNFIDKLINDNRIWRLIALLSLAIVVLSTIGWFTALNMKKESLLVVEVNELGRARYVGQMTGSSNYNASQIKDYMVESIIRDFLEYTRGIHLDYEIMNENYKKAMMWCSDNMKLKLRDELLAEDTGSKVGRVKRFVSIESILRLTNSSWQFDWFDIENNMAGHEISRVRYRGVFSVIKEDPGNETERYYNPLGVYIVDYNITRVNEVLR